METLTQLIQYWLIKNISHKPQIIRSPTLPKGILILNPGQSDWVDCTVHQQVEQSDWCQSLANDVNYESEIGSAPPDNGVYVNLTERVRDGSSPIPETIEVVATIIEDINAPVEVAVVTNKCTATTKAGKPCPNYKMTGTEFCIVHQPKTE